MNTLRHYLPLAIAFTLGASLASLQSAREQASLLQDAEHAYHEGFLDGRADSEATREYYQTERYLTVQPTEECYEDEPCWDCATMGNRKCGPTLGVVVRDLPDGAQEIVPMVIK